MLNYCAIFLTFFLVSCASYAPPPQFHYQKIKTNTFTLASWQKISSPNATYKIYIEGDGYAFNTTGHPSHNPTPKQTTMRRLAFGDPSPNVIYLARPCQFIKSDICSTRHWTTARFAPEAINATTQAIQQIAGNNKVILIGYSGGAQVAGLIAVNKPQIHTKKLITIAGNLDHLAWTSYHKLPPLNESMSLESYQNQYAKIPQIHYIGADDKIIPPILTQNFVKDSHKIKIIPHASHNSGFEDIYPLIWAEN